MRKTWERWKANRALRAEADAQAAAIREVTSAPVASLETWQPRDGVKEATRRQGAALESLISATTQKPG